MNELEMLGQIAAKSIRNCHAPECDSILFDDTPGARVRAFIVGNGHNLFQNYGMSGKPLSVALHSHHCAVRLVPIFGRVYNVRPIGHLGRPRYAQFKFQSQINSGKGGFTRTPGDDNTMAVRLDLMELKRSVDMKASDIHTIAVAYGEPAAWMVYEGEEDPTYDGMCYSDADLENFDFSALYKPMSVDYLHNLLGTMRLCSTPHRWKKVNSELRKLQEKEAKKDYV